MSIRCCFAGSSGTGKTRLATYVAEHYKIPLNPIGSRSVAASMGFASPYDVDKAGQRAAFQERLLSDKIDWERDHVSFVSDRSTYDNLAYTMVHDIHSIDARTLERASLHMLHYTHVFYCPFTAFCKVGGDTARINDRTYQELYDSVLYGLLSRGLKIYTLDSADFSVRQAIVRAALKGLTH